MWIKLYMPTNLGSCGIIFLSIIDRQNWTCAFLFDSIKNGLTGLVCQRISSSYWTLRWKADLLTSVAQATDQILVLLERRILWNWLGSITIILRSQFFVLRWLTSTTSLFKLFLDCFHIRETVCFDTEKDYAISGIVPWRNFPLLLLRSKSK